DTFWEALSLSEKQKAERFRLPADRDRSVLARGLARDVLSRYLGKESGELSLGVDAHGKPILLSDSAHPHPDLFFNVSHSHELILCAVGLAPVGVDTEWDRPLDQLSSLSRLVLSAAELSELERCPSSQRGREFLRYWTRKEAYAKGVGLGLGMALTEVSANLEPGGWWRMSSASESRGWFVRELSAHADYVAALASPVRDCRLRCWQWAL
ncbi:MAG: 4'-phosphopantetheinyl transferase family protein, partial [Roseimicrobium sp.]